jgi:hypothetical protein
MMTTLLGLLPPPLSPGWVRFERTEGQRGSDPNGYTSMVGVSDESDTISRGPAVLLTPERRGHSRTPGVRR